jgi:hypothetical protein
MFKKGIGDRFSYKNAVRERYPSAVCKRSGVAFSKDKKNFTEYGFSVFIDDKQITDVFNSPENAWANAWATYVRENEILSKKQT